MNRKLAVTVGVTYGASRRVAAFERDAGKLLDRKQRPAVVHALVTGRYDAAGCGAFGDCDAPLVHGESVTVL